jgi:hypothetical protein
MDDLDGLVLVHRIRCRIAELRRRTGIDRRPVGPAAGQRESFHVAPVWADRLLDAVGHRDPVLGDHVLDLEGLPAVRVDHRRPWLSDGERRVHRRIVRRRVSAGLVRAVRLAVRQDGRSDPVAERGRRIALGRGHIEGVAHRVHQVREFREGGLRAHRPDVSGGQHPIGRVAHGLVAGSRRIGGVQLLLHEIARGRAIVGRPCIPHRRRSVEQVPRVHGGRRKGAADGIQEGLVPAAGDGPLGMLGDGRAGRLLRPGPDGDERGGDQGDRSQPHDGGDDGRALHSASRRLGAPGGHRIHLDRPSFGVSPAAAQRSRGRPGRGRRAWRWYRG